MLDPFFSVYFALRLEAEWLSLETRNDVVVTQAELAARRLNDYIFGYRPARWEE